MNERDPVLREAFRRFENLLDLDAEERTRSLRDLQFTQPELYPEIMALLSAAAAAGDFLEGGQSVNVGDLDAAGTLKGGDRLGNYEVLAPIGSGGMGEVWRARRTDGAYDAPVALKALYPHLAIGSLRGRFVREGRILGGLSHPHIARLLDAGISAGGSLYMILEYVDGTRIDEWADAHAASVEARIRLFMQVCEAVAYAQTQMIVHRDLKPSNILVTAEGLVKLLDFGVAKLVQGDSTAQPVNDQTRIGDRALTPDYAAPEQFAGSSVSAATDVYSLGIVLYELVCGCRPFAGSQPAIEGENLAMRRYVAPSQRGVAGGASLGGRAASARELCRALQGDIDAIVAKAMRFEPNERYPDARALRDDLERYLRHQPVHARIGARGYVWRRFARRNWVVLCAMCAVFVALLAGIVGIAWQARIAKREAATAEAVQRFVENIFHANSQNQPDAAKARQTTARELLDVGAGQLESSMTGTPAAKLRVLHTLVNMYDELGVSDRTLELERRSLALARTYYGKDDPALAQLLTEFGNTAERVDLHGEALPAYEEAERILDRARDWQSPIRAELENALAYFYDSTNPEMGLPHAERSVAAYRGFGNSVLLVNALKAESNLDTSLGRYSAARAAAREALDDAVKLGAEANQEVSDLHEALGYAEAGLDHLGPAEREFRQSIEIASAGSGDPEMDKLEAMGPYGDFLLETGRTQAALGVLRSARDIAAVLTGVRADTSRPLRTLMRLGRAQLTAGQLEAGMRTLADVETSLAAHAGEPFTELMAQLSDAQAVGMMSEGRYAEADAQLSKAAILHRESGEEGTPYGNKNVVTKIRLLMAEGRMRDARALFSNLWSGRDAPPDSRSELEKKILAAELALKMGDPGARALARQELAVITDSPNREFLAAWELRAAAVEGQALRREGRFPEAQPLLARSLDLATSLFDQEQSPDLAEAELALAACDLDMGRSSTAQELLAVAERIQSSHPVLGEQYRAPLRDLQTRIASAR